MQKSHENNEELYSQIIIYSPIFFIARKKRVWLAIDIHIYDVL
jgi:hypothetical protein